MGKTFTLRIDGTEYEIEQKGRAILVNGTPFEPLITGNTVAIGTTKRTVELDGERLFVDGIARHYETEGLQESTTDHEGAADNAPADGALTAIMPGLIIKVLTTEGAAVATGDVLVILEAMKMENEICAPKDGVVQELRVKAGDSVQQNQILAVIE